MKPTRDYSTADLGITYNFFFLSVCTYSGLIWLMLCISRLTLERGCWLATTLLLIYNFATSLRNAWFGNAIRPLRKRSKEIS